MDVLERLCAHNSNGSEISNLDDISLFHSFRHDVAKQLLELDGLGIEVFFNHKGNLENDCMVKLAQIQTGELLNLLKTVNKSVSMYKELS